MSDDKPYFEKKTLPDDHPVIRLLNAVLEDARAGGVTSIAMITVDGSGLRVQTPAQFYQVRELLYGVEELRKKLIMDYQVGATGVVDGMRQ